MLSLGLGPVGHHQIGEGSANDGGWGAGKMMTMIFNDVDREQSLIPQGQISRRKRQSKSQRSAMSF